MRRDSSHPTSFICERSAEFVLTRRLADLLNGPFPKAVFLQFWGTREGSRIAKSCMGNTPVSLGLVFARRPKIYSPADDTVLIKINSEIFRAAAVAHEYGIPLLTGAPIINNLLDLRMLDRCAWFQLHGDYGDNDDCEICLAIEGTRLLSTLPPYVTGPLPEDKVPAHLKSDRIFTDWEDACTAIMDVKRAAPRAPFGGVYRPFVVVFPEEI